MVGMGLNVTIKTADSPDILGLIMLQDQSMFVTRDYSRIERRTARPELSSDEKTFLLNIIPLSQNHCYSNS